MDLLAQRFRALPGKCASPRHNAGEPVGTGSSAWFPPVDEAATRPDDRESPRLGRDDREAARIGREDREDREDREAARVGREDREAARIGA
ncbi:hypothetical protein GCM10010206_57610 [Streptomyces cinerochromogenes]|nr:hypothetical protein GCM10010206_57610 [Streptomyces cinerochromogenes]